MAKKATDPDPDPAETTANRFMQNEKESVDDIMHEQMMRNRYPDAPMFKQTPRNPTGLGRIVRNVHRKIYEGGD